MSDLQTPIPVSLDVSHITRVEQDYPSMGLLAGDYLYVLEAGAAEVGQLIIANIDQLYAPRVYDGVFEVHGVVVGLFRVFGGVDA